MSKSKKRPIIESDSDDSDASDLEQVSTSELFGQINSRFKEG